MSSAVVIDLNHLDVQFCRRPVAPDYDAPAKRHLKLSRVINSEGKVPRVRSRIDRGVFDEKWIDDCLAASKALPAAARGGAVPER